MVAFSMCSSTRGVGRPASCAAQLGVIGPSTGMGDGRGFGLVVGLASNSQADHREVDSHPRQPPHQSAAQFRGSLAPARRRAGRTSTGRSGRQRRRALSRPPRRRRGCQGRQRGPRHFVDEPKPLTRGIRALVPGSTCKPSANFPPPCSPPAWSHPGHGGSHWSSFSEEGSDRPRCPSATTQR